MDLAVLHYLDIRKTSIGELTDINIGADCKQSVKGAATCRFLYCRKSRKIYERKMDIFLKKTVLLLRIVV